SPRYVAYYIKNDNSSFRLISRLFNSTTDFSQRHKINNRPYFLSPTPSFQSIKMLKLAALAALAALTSATVSLAERSGKHFANAYSANSCSGQVLATVHEFGCGGQCHRVSGGHSILLSQEGTGNPKPTAAYYSDENCQHHLGDAGIFKGEHSGCTNSRETFGSFYLYFNC
ncbi:hypothetical protein V493_07241, partial [Pseudogymnoascus sp. VKM F-4281 (FW-2241)]